MRLVNDTITNFHLKLEMVKELEKAKAKKLKMLKEEFYINLEQEDVKLINNAETVYKLDRIARDLFKKYL